MSKKTDGDRWPKQPIIKPMKMRCSIKITKCFSEICV
jgi:hypothetical protein